jgi:hypothetical protein
MYILGYTHFCFNYSYIIPLAFKGVTDTVSVEQRCFFLLFCILKSGHLGVLSDVLGRW